MKKDKSMPQQAEESKQPPVERYFLIPWGGYVDGSFHAGTISYTSSGGYPNLKELSALVRSKIAGEALILPPTELTESDFNDWIKD